MKGYVARLAGTIVAFTLLCGAHASAQTEAWNQEKATALASELEKAVSGLRDAVRKSPTWQDPLQRKTLNQITRKLRAIESESLSLHAKLKNGATMEATRNSYNRIQALRRDAAVQARKTDVSAFTQPKLDRALEVLNQMAPFYPAEPKPEAEPPIKEEPKS